MRRLASALLAPVEPDRDPDKSALATPTTAGRAHARRDPVLALLRAHSGVVAVIAACAWWLIEVTRSWAGRDAPSVTVGAILLALAVALTRPHRVLPPTAMVLATATSVGAFVVPLTAPSGWAGAPDGAIYACGVWLAVVVAATVVARPDMWIWFLMLVATSAPIEFMSGWLGWWGGEDPTRPMLGTFYWHNPYAAFLIPGGLVGLALWIWRDRLLALLGLVCFTFAAIGVMYSTSRAGLGTFVLGAILVFVTATVGADRWRALRQLVVAVVVAAAATYFVSGPPFFSHRGSPLAAEQARAATQSLGQNTGQRIDFWRQAFAVFRHHPLTGGGYKSLVAEAIGHVPRNMPLSSYAHNGYLQALGEGGLILGLPFLIAVVILAFLCLRILFRGLLRREVAPETIVVAIAFGAVLLHSGVDFDWSYAANFAMAAILGGLVLGFSLTERDPAKGPKPRNARPVALALCVLLGVSTLGVSAWVQRNGNHTVNINPSASGR